MKHLIKRLRIRDKFQQKETTLLMINQSIVFKQWVKQSILLQSVQNSQYYYMLAPSL